jgi:hypothetical protein
MDGEREREREAYKEDRRRREGREGEGERERRAPLRFLQHRVGPLGGRGGPFVRRRFPVLAGSVGLVERDADAALFCFERLSFLAEGRGQG